MKNKAEPWTTGEVNTLPSEYQCEIILRNVERKDINCKELPSDSYIVEYNDTKGKQIDICRSQKLVMVFDLYYDKFGNHIDKIEQSNGRISPRNWKRK